MLQLTKPNKKLSIKHTVKPVEVLSFNDWCKYIRSERIRMFDEKIKSFNNNKITLK